MASPVIVVLLHAGRSTFRPVHLPTAGEPRPACVLPRATRFDAASSPPVPLTAANRQRRAAVVGGAAASASTPTRRSDEAADRLSWRDDDPRGRGVPRGP